jgi:hypothetical protein
MSLVWIFHDKELCNCCKTCGIVTVVRQKKVTMGCTHAQDKADRRIPNFCEEDVLLDRESEKPY